MLYLRDATVIDWETLAQKRGNLEVSEFSSRFVAKIPPGAKVVDCAGKFVTKSFAIAHHHLYSALARGMPAPKRSPKSFVDILKLIWWNLDKKLDHDMIRACALAGAIDAAKSGATFVIDHHSSPNAIKGSLSLIAECLEEVGLSHLLCYELSDRDGLARRDEGLAETASYLKKRPGLVGLHASFTVSDELLKKAVDLAHSFGTGIHVHAAEAASDETDCVKKYGCRVVERFAKTGALDIGRTLLAHGVHFDQRERKIFKNSAAWLVENSESNQNNGVGKFSDEGLGDRILIGTDGMHGSALQSARASFLSGGLTPVAAYARLCRVNDYLRRNGLDSVEGDLVILDYQSPTPVTKENWPAHVVYALDREHVESVISRGRLIVDKRRMVLVNEDEILKSARKQAERLWRKL